MHALVAGPSLSTENPTQALLILGHAVSACHDGAGDECVALRGKPCPLDASPVDVVVADEGSETARCARLRHLPVVSYDLPATSAETEAELLAATTTLPGHTAAAGEGVSRALAAAGCGLEGVKVSVTRRHGGLLVRVVGHDPMGASLRQRISVRVLAEVRAFDRWAKSIDVVITEAEESAHAASSNRLLTSLPFGRSSECWPSRWTSPLDTTSRGA